MFYKIHRSKRILITGASGFVGSTLVDTALLQGHEVYAGIRSTSSRKYLVNPLVHLFTMDLSSMSALEQQLRALNDSGRPFDVIIHNAGITRANRKDDFDLVNHQYTRNLAEALINTSSIPDRFVYMSSLATYGPGDPRHLEPIRLDDRQKPVSAYAASKLAAERYLRSLSSIDAVFIRPTAVYGPRDKDFYSYFRMLQHGFDVVPGRHRQLLSFIYVSDLADAVLSIATNPTTQSAYILSDDRTYEGADLGTIISRVLTVKPLRLRLPLLPVRMAVGAVQGVYGLFNSLPFIHTEKLAEIAAPNWSCDSSLTWKELGQRPVYDLEKGVINTARWYKDRGWL